MNIRNRQNYANAFWDWSFLNQSFAPTKIRLSDIDGIVERNGQFLCFETKPLGVEPDYGQQILLNELSYHPNWTVVILYGEKNRPEKYRKLPNGSLMDCDLSLVQRRVRAWFVNANKKKIAVIKTQPSEDDHSDWLKAYDSVKS